MGVEIQVGGLWKEAADRTPIGMISAFGGTVAPDGWFICDGTAKSRTTYADLYAVIGTGFGAGDGTSTFNLPNLQGVGLTGAGSQSISGRTKTGPALGTAREDQIQGHLHGTSAGAFRETDQPAGTVAAAPAVWDSSATTRPQTVLTDGTNGTPRIGAYTHGPEVGVNYMIKY